MKKALLMTSLISGLLLCTRAWAEPEVVNEDSDGECGATCHWTYTADTGTLIFTGTGEAGFDVNWYMLYGYIENVEFSEGITSIPEEFLRDFGLHSVTIPSTVTHIGAKAFRGNTLTDVTISDNMPLDIYSYSIFDDLSNTTVHCQGNTETCRTKLEEAGYTEILSIVPVSSQETSTQDTNVKRIYTVEEAAALVKPTGNTFRIKYK